MSPRLSSTASLSSNGASAPAFPDEDANVLYTPIACVTCCHQKGGRDMCEFITGSSAHEEIQLIESLKERKNISADNKATRYIIGKQNS